MAKRKTGTKAQLKVIDGDADPKQMEALDLLARPEFLPTRAGQLWDKLVKQLGEAGIVEEVDGPALMNLVMAYHFALYAGALLLKDGLVEIDPAHQNRKRKHPAWQMWRESQAAFSKWADKFKVTPAARQGPLAKAEDEVSELEKILSGG